MRLIAILTLFPVAVFGYDLAGRIEPPALYSVFLQSATAPFEQSQMSGPDGHFRFHGIPQGTYTISVATPARGEVRRTVDVGPGTANAGARVEVAIRTDDGGLESEGYRVTGATVKATVLSIPDRALKEYGEAQKCLGHGDSDCASGHLTRAVQIAPQFAAAWNYLGTIAYQEKRYKDAETNFRKSLDADPELFEPLVNLGGVLLNLGRPREALQYNQRAVTRRPNDALANSQLGFTYFELSSPNTDGLDEAEKYLKAAIAIDPTHFSHPQLTLAEIYVRRGNRAAAADTLRDFLARHPDAPDADRIRQQIAELGR